MTGVFRKTSFLFATMAIVLIASGCAGVRMRQAVPENLEDNASPLGSSTVRTWGDTVSGDYIDSLVESVRQEKAYYAANPQLSMPKTVDILCLSGGGEDGAFGAGILCGWTAHGDRPQFKLVTGISTGALIAPWAFLGSDYDDRLRQNYTRVSKNDIFISRGIFAIFGADGLMDTSPLRRLVAELVDDKVLQAVAAEHRKGRRLLIGTTNLDAQRPVIWDMGAIACSDDPHALELFRQVMVASASIPVAFPPVYITVEADGKKYDEMHVDGGAVSQVFLWGGGFSATVANTRLGTESMHRSGRLFVIRNSMVSPAWEQVTPKLFPIAGRAVSTLIMANGINDLIRLQSIAARDNLDFNLAYIPPKAVSPLTEPFDTKYMNNLFDFGYDRSKGGYPWLKTAPITITPTSEPTID
jgi:predicted acylesterase/phospholipase RssA